MSTETRTPARSVVGRTLGAVAVLGVCGALAVVGQGVPPVAPRPVEARAVGVPPGATDLVCPGPVRLATEPQPGDDAAYDPQFDPSPEDAVSRLVALTVPAGDGGAPAAPSGSATLGPLAGAGQPDASAVSALEPLSSDSAAVAVLDAIDAPLVLRAEPSADQPAWAAGALAVTTGSGDLRGLVAASCQAPAGEQWLVGGSTALGSSGRLVLTNPGRTAATATVEMWGPAGPVEVAGASTYLVPPGTEVAVLLEGLAAEQPRVVVRVTAAGGLVTAYVQDSALRGLVPAGVDDVVPGRAPALRQVVAAVDVPETAADGADVAAVRLLAPDGATSARLTFLGPEGPVELPGAGVVDLEAGTVLDVPLGGLPEGRYTVVVDADAPVVAGVLLTRGAGVGVPVAEDASTDDGADPPPLDRAWLPSVAPGVPGPLALPPGTAGHLVLGVVPPADGPAAGPAELTLDVVDRDGVVVGTRDLRLAEGRTTALPLDDLLDGALGDPSAAAVPVGVVVRSDDPRLAWGAVLDAGAAGGPLIGVLVPVAPRVAEPSVSVRVRG